MSGDSTGPEPLKPADKRELLARLLKQKLERGSAFPLSHGQKALWLIHRMAPESAAYNVVSSAWIRSTLDVAALRRALEKLTQRHEMLRASFETSDGEPRQRIQPSVAIMLDEHDASAWTDSELDARVLESSRQPFDLERGPVFRASLFHRGEHEHVLLLAIHHIVVDGRSLTILANEWLTLYAAEQKGIPEPLEALPARYRDFVRWQDDLVTGSTGQEMWAFWKEQLQPLPSMLELPTDRARPAKQSFRGETRSWWLDEEVTTALRTQAGHGNTTLFTVLLAAFWVLLHRYTGKHDIVVGSPTAGRSSSFEHLVGYFVNPVALRGSLDGDPSFVQLLGRARRVVIDALRNGDYPFPLVVQRLNPPRDTSYSPVFQVDFSLIKVDQRPTSSSDSTAATASSATSGGAVVEPLLLPQQEGQFDLALEVLDYGPRLLLNLKYATDLFDEATIRRMSGHLEEVLRGIVERPEARVSELGLLTDGEREEQRRWNGTESEIGGESVQDLISEQAGRTPDRVAVECGDEVLTYRQLESRSEAVSRRLSKLGVGPGSLVGVYMERTPHMVAGLVGVWKAGCAYVPLDPGFPAERLSYMVEDSGASVLLTEKGLEDSLPSRGIPFLVVDEDEEERAGGGASTRGCGPHDLAYVIYTSGSTGKPKGVAITQRSLLNLLESMGRAPGFGEGDVLLSVTTLSFDIAALELYLPLLKGGKVLLATREEAADGRRLMDLLSRGATVLQATPATWWMLLESGWEGTPGLKVLCGGEALPRELAAVLLSRAGEVWNVYGPTETTVWSSVDRVQSVEGPISIGRPIGNTQMWVLDERRSPQPVGVAGELYIGGAGLARGYWKREELTAEKFVPDPFSVEPGSRLYRTGDLARWLPDGRLECLGRIDHQVKVRGFRIELGEIESALQDHPEVEQAVVLAQESGTDRRLVGYVIQRSVEASDVAALRAHLGARLPAYMIPSAFVFVESFPLTPNGKVDRRALGQLGAETKPEKGEAVAPRTPTEEILAGIWSEVLGIDGVGVEDDFFALGGHSLLATQVVSRTRKALGVDVPLREIFAAPTVAGVSRRIDELRAAEERAGMEVPNLVARPGTGPAHLSFAQERLWFLDQVEAQGSAYAMTGAVELRGVLDPAALEGALGEIVRRHEPLRTRFEWLDGEPRQVVDDTHGFQLPVTDLGGNREALPGTLKEQAREGFDLERGPLFRARLFRLGPEEHVLLVGLHHIVSDAWSLGLLVRELAKLYGARIRGEETELPPLPVNYRDYARWQREWLKGEFLSRELDHWRGRLEGVPRVLDLPTDRPRPGVESHRGAMHSFVIPREVAEGLQRISRGEGATLFMALLAVFDVLLWRYTGQEDLLVGTPVANRNRAELEGLIGLFVNTLVLRGELGGDPTFRELLGRVRETCLDAYGHEDLPFERLVEDLRPERDMSRNPLFQVMLVLQNAPVSPADLPGLTLRPLAMDRGAAQVDLTLYVHDTTEGLRGTCEYATDLFDEATILRLEGHFLRLLGGVVGDPGCRISALPLLTEGESDEQVGWQGPEVEVSQGCVQDLIAVQAARVPDRVAVEGHGGAVSYGALEKRAERVSRRLAELGVGPGVLVGVYMERSPEMVAGLLGVWKAGGAYVPLDPGFPPERLSYMVEDSGAAVLLTEKALEGSLPSRTIPALVLDDDPGDESLPVAGGRRSGPDDLAYVIYTSGSTGKPKGVAITHKSLVNFLESMGREPGLGEGDVLLSVTTLSFDIAALELFLPLLQGARVLLATREEAADGRRLVDLLARGTTVLQATPATWRLLLDSGWPGTPGLKVLCGGEALPGDLARDLLRRAGEVWNVYGPTETTVWSSACRVESGEGLVSIGRPIANTQMWVLDSRRQPVPAGVTGELYIGGLGLARGYWERPELTAEKFIEDPFSESPGARLYRTGDLARWLPDGRLECLGRIDHQVKVRGFRIELGEIESALQQLPGVEQAVALVQDLEADRRLVAYVVPGLGEPPPARALRQGLGRRLPSYMVPSAFVVVERIPLTPNGKVDRRALAQMGVPANPGRIESVAPRTPTEKLVAEVWSEILGVPNVAVKDNFFDLGGHSLLAMRMLAALEKRTGRRLHARDAVVQTLEGLAARVDEFARPATPRRPDSPGVMSRLLEAARGLLSI